jgi:hypothetical protein
MLSDYLEERGAAAALPHLEGAGIELVHDLQLLNADDLASLGIEERLQALILGVSADTQAVSEPFVQQQPQPVQAVQQGNTSKSELSAWLNGWGVGEAEPALLELGVDRCDDLRFFTMEDVIVLGLREPVRDRLAYALGLYVPPPDGETLSGASGGDEVAKHAAQAEAARTSAGAAPAASAGGPTPGPSMRAERAPLPDSTDQSAAHGIMNSFLADRALGGDDRQSYLRRQHSSWVGPDDEEARGGSDSEGADSEEFDGEADEETRAAMLSRRKQQPQKGKGALHSRGSVLLSAKDGSATKHRKESL